MTLFILLITYTSENAYFCSYWASSYWNYQCYLRCCHLTYHKINQYSSCHSSLVDSCQNVQKRRIVCVKTGATVQQGNHGSITTLRNMSPSGSCRYPCYWGLTGHLLKNSSFGSWSPHSSRADKIRQGATFRTHIGLHIYYVQNHYVYTEFLTFLFRSKKRRFISAAKRTGNYCLLNTESTSSATEKLQFSIYN